MAECIDLYVQGILKLGKELPNAQELAAVESRIAERQKILSDQGLSIDSIDPVDGRRWGDKIADDEVKNFIRTSFLEDPLDDSAQTWANTLRDADQLTGEIKKAYPRYSDSKARLIALNSVLVDNNFTYNTKNLESIFIAEKQTTHGDFYNRIQNELPDFDLDSEFRNAEFSDAFINELMRMQDLEQWPTAKMTKLPTSSKEAHIVARAFVEEAIQKPNLKMIVLGRQDKRAFANKLRVEITAGHLKESFTNSTEFADFMLENLKVEKYTARLGDRETTRGMLIDIYDKMITDESFTWRNIDNFINEYERSTAIDNRVTLNGLEYRDGAAFKAVNERIGFNQNIANLVLNTMQYNSQLVGFTKFFGHNWVESFDYLKRTMKQLKNELPSGIAEVKTLRMESDAILSWVESRIDRKSVV